MTTVITPTRRTTRFPVKPHERATYQPANVPTAESVDKVFNESPALSAMFNGTSLPDQLYHGSAYKQTELKPGYQHSKKIVNWDKYESNIYLYATSDLKAAELLGISSAWEKKYDLASTHFDAVGKSINLVFNGEPPSIEELKGIVGYLYTIKYVPGVWIRNHNPYNNIDNEYKTQKTVTDIISVDEINVQEVLKDFAITVRSA